MPVTPQEDMRATEILDALAFGQAPTRYALPAPPKKRSAYLRAQANTYRAYAKNFWEQARVCSENNIRQGNAADAYANGLTAEAQRLEAQGL